MTDLLSQLERATEGSRELDGRVYCAVRGLQFHMWDGAGIVVRKPEFRHIESERVKYYTTNLQDAVSLVPEGFGWSVTYLWDGRCGATCGRHHADFKGETPCLALCIAIIKAHESKAEAA